MNRAMFVLHGKITKSGSTVRARHNLCLVRCVHKTRCLPMFRINRQIPRCVLTWVMVVIAFCYDVLCEPCDGFSDLLSVFCWNFMLHLGVCFLIFSFEVPSVGWIFLGYVWGFKKDSFTFVVAFQSLLGR